MSLECHADMQMFRGRRDETSGPFPSSSVPVFYTRNVSVNYCYRYPRRFNKLQTVPPHAIGPVCPPPAASPLPSFPPSASSLPPVSISVVVSAAHYNGFYGVLPPCPLLRSLPFLLRSRVFRPLLPASPSEVAARSRHRHRPEMSTCPFALPSLHSPTRCCWLGLK